ncbi:unnamed protein product [Symbiodinium sp. KB8]|nr:unnamed protein product [Symbiodinium sp. KB8]
MWPSSRQQRGLHAVLPPAVRKESCQVLRGAKDGGQGAFRDSALVLPGTLQHQPLQGEEYGHHAGRGRPAPPREQQSLRAGNDARWAAACILGYYSI